MFRGIVRIGVQPLASGCIGEHCTGSRYFRPSAPDSPSCLIVFPPHFGAHWWRLSESFVASKGSSFVGCEMEQGN